MFSTREIATGLWIVIFLFFMLVNEQARNSIFELLKIIFCSKIRILWISYLVYITGITFVFSRTDIWKNLYLKDIIIWSFTSGIVIAVNSADRDAVDDYIVKVLKNNIKPMIFIEFLMSTFTFNFIIEFVTIPVIVFCSLIELFSQIKDEKQVEKFANTVLGIIGVWIIYGTISVALSEYAELNYSDTLISFLIPILYLLLCIPFLFFWLIVAKYDTLFFRMSEDEENVCLKKRFSKRVKVIRICKFSCSRIIRFTRGYTYKRCSSMSERDFEELIDRFQRDIDNDCWYINDIYGY